MLNIKSINNVTVSVDSRYVIKSTSTDFPYCLSEFDLGVNLLYENNHIFSLITLSDVDDKSCFEKFELTFNASEIPLTYYPDTNYSVYMTKIKKMLALKY